MLVAIASVVLWLSPALPVQADPAKPTPGGAVIQTPAAKSAGKGSKKATTPEEREKEKEEAKKEAERVKAERYKLPVVEVIAPPEKPVDAAAMFNAALGKLGFAKFKELKSITFERETWQMREGKRTENDFSAWDSTRTVAKPGLPLVGRTELTSNVDEHNRQIPFYAVVNGDDRFEQRLMTVLSTEQHEKDAVSVFAREIFYPLAPFVLGQTGAQAEYVGQSTLKGFDPKSYDPDKKGWTDYEAVTKIYDVLRFKVPEPFDSVAGKSVELYIESGSGRIAMLAAQDLYHQENFQASRLLYEYAETTTIDGVVVPTKMRTFLDFDAYRLESTDLVKYALDAPIDPRILKRP